MLPEQYNSLYDFLLACNNETPLSHDESVKLLQNWYFGGLRFIVYMECGLTVFNNSILIELGVGQNKK